MLLPLKAIISKDTRKDGTCLISFQYCYSSAHRVLLGTEIAIPFSWWNKKRQCISKSMPVEFGDAETLNSNLSHMKKVIEATIEQGMVIESPHMGTYVKERFTPQLQLEEVLKTSNLKPIAKKAPDFFTEVVCLLCLFVRADLVS